MNKQLILIIILFLQTLSVFIPTSVATEYIIDGDKVYIDDEFVYLSAEPHTIMQDTDVVFELISKQFGGEIDVAFGINCTNMSVKNPQLWNGTAWNPLNKEIQVVNQEYLGYDRWYLLKNVNINEDVLYRLKLNVDIIFNTSGKYFFGVKRSVDPINQGYYIDPWWNSSWTYCRTLTLDSLLVDNDLVNFPLLVMINSIIGALCDDGDSIRFVDAANTTEYYYQIETWNGGAGNSPVWVNVTSVLSGSDTKVNFYYNNSAASDNQNTTNVWNNNYIAVFHMNEPSGNINDSTSNYNNFTLGAGNPTYHATGKIGYGIQGDNSNAYFKNTTMDLTGLSAMSVEWWYDCVDGSEEDTQIFSSKYDNSNDIRIKYDGGSGANDNGFSAIWDDGVVDGCSDYTNNYNQAFRYAAATINNGDAAYLYVNTTEVGNDSAVNYDFVGMQTTHRIGARLLGTSNYFEGILDEIRIANVAFNSSWLNATYHSQNQSLFTWGDEYTSGFFPDAPTNFVANATSNSVINLTWTIGNNATHTYITRKAGSYPLNRGDGTNIYNNTGVLYSDSSLSPMVVYYYRAWSYNGTTGNYSTTFTSVSNHTGATNPTSVSGDVATGYLNISWTKGTRADDTTIIRKVSGYPSSPSDGTEIYNSSGTFYNDTTFYSGYYTLYSWNDTNGLFSTGIDLLWGSLTINVYDENTSDAIVNWDVFITNETGTETYESLGNSNPHTIDISILPNGANVAIKINATDYDFRLYYMDIYANNQYDLDTYLAPMNITELYLLTVVDEIDNHISDAKMQIQRYINASVGYEDVSIRLTDANGQVAIYLIPDELYKFIITKTGYVTEIADYIPDEEIREKTFRMNSVETEWEYYIFWDYIEFSGSMNADGNITISYSDSSLLTADTQIYLYDRYNRTDTLINTDMRTSNSFSYTIFSCNNSRLHYALLYFNHSYNFSIIQPVTVYIQPTNKTFEPHTITDLEGAFTSIFGNNPLGWGNSIAFIVAFIVLCSFAPYDVGAAIIGAGLSLLGVESAFVINPILIITVPIIIAIGIFYLIAMRQAEEMV